MGNRNDTPIKDAPHFDDAIALLIYEHELVKAKFGAFAKLGDKAFASKKKLVDEICFALTNHTTLEEELFYPTVRREIASMDALVDEAIVEHGAAKELITQIQAMSAEDSLFDAKVKVLSEQIDHHVAEEEQQMFPEVKKSSIDLAVLRDKMLTRKQHLSAQVPL